MPGMPFSCAQKDERMCGTSKQELRDMMNIDVIPRKIYLYIFKIRFCCARIPNRQKLHAEKINTNNDKKIKAI
jgi:hypothetical protein